MGSPWITGRIRRNRQDLQRADRAQSQQDAGDRQVVLGDAGLDQVTDHDQQDQVEGLQR
jgi:hypothetical protein